MKRYDFEDRQDRFPRMAEHVDGEYVKYDDIVETTAYNEGWNAAIKAVLAKVSAK
jgi:hypothetical protein